MNAFNPSDLWYNSPLVIVTLTGLSVLVLEGIRRNNERAAFAVTIAGLLAALGLSCLTYGSYETTFGGMVVHSVFGNYFTIIFLLAGILSVAAFRDFLKRFGIERSEYYALVLFAIAGMILMATADDLVVLFLGIELMSISFYVLAGFMRKTSASNEAALKYFLLGAFTTGFLLYGIALMYGVSGTTSLSEIRNLFGTISERPLFLIGIGLIIMALAFKIGAAPFHMWAPDVYEGAPTSVTAFMATAGKAAAFAAFLTVFVRGLDFSGTQASTLIGFIAALSMIVGNVTAISQNSVKRMLAYSSIAHAGYMLSGIAAGNQEGQTGIMFYAAAYLFMNIGAFSIVGMVEGDNGSRLTFDDYAGLSSRRPLISAFMALFLFSLAGIPPFAGFFGKYYVFLAAVKADMTWLAIVGVLTSLISVYYYLRLVVQMYFREGEGDTAVRPASLGVVAVGFAALMILQLGLYPSFILRMISGQF